MRIFYPVISLVDAMIWVFGSSSERLEAEIQNKRRLIREIVSRSSNCDARWEQVWRGLAYAHLSHIQQLESKRLKYVTQSIVGVVFAMSLIIWVGVALVKLEGFIG